MDVRFFQNLKMAKLFQQNHHFIAFLFIRFVGGGRGFVKRVCFVMHMKTMEKIDDP